METTYEKLERFRILDQRLKLLEKEHAALKKELTCGYFSTHDEFIYDSRLLATYKSYPKMQFQQAIFKTEKPLIYTSYCLETIERKFLLK